jgi:hypothetical protein
MCQCDLVKDLHAVGGNIERPASEVVEDGQVDGDPSSRTMR